MNLPRTTPMMQQYLSIKEKYPDAILFYRMGDFYEMFYEDALTAAPLLQIALTSRNKQDAAPVPMCGVPCKAVRGYLARLIAQGFKVAICDQLEEPSATKGLVRREVVRVVTPGMLIEEELLDARIPNHLAALCLLGPVVGLASGDISTGALQVCEAQDLREIAEELERIAAREIVLPATLRDGGLPEALRPLTAACSLTYVEERFFAPEEARERLLRAMGTLNLEGFGCEGLKAGIGALGGLLGYVEQTQQGGGLAINRLNAYQLDAFLQIDENSCRNLELLVNLRTGQRSGSLLAVIDLTVSAMGGRLLRRWLRYPLRDPEAIAARHDAVEEAVKGPGARRSLRELLKTVQDLERIESRLALGQGSARDLLALKRSLQVLPALRQALQPFASRSLGWGVCDGRLDALAELLDRAVRDDAPLSIGEGGMIKPGFDPELDALLAISREGKGGLARLEIEERAATGIAALKVRFNRVFGYTIEIPRSQAEAVPPHYIRRQTLAGVERYVTEALQAYEARVLGAEAERAALEGRIFGQLRDAVLACRQLLSEGAERLAEIDCLLALAEAAERYDYTRPEMGSPSEIRIEEGRHPVVERHLEGQRFVPNTIRLDDAAQQVLIITGPNMAGKSTVLRQVALVVLMAQMGSFVPARRAVLGITDRIFTRVGALDNLSQGQSTFMVEMQETARILNGATPCSLVVLDEIGRGTSTFDGLSIAWAVAEYLHDLDQRGVKTLFATHYHELTELADIKARVKNCHMAVKEWNDQIIFLRNLAPGGTNRSYGIQVARLAGIPEGVLARARHILQRIETGRPALETLQRRPGRASPGARGARRQLTLFQAPLQALVEDLRLLDLSRMTPLEALNRLSALQAKAAEWDG
jgi:DNA mismatch repair protein MutS